MTAVVGFIDGGRVYMAADRRATDGSGNEACLAHPKIAKFKGYVVGVCGLIEVTALLRRLEPPRAPRKGEDPQYWVENTLLKELTDLDDCWHEANQLIVGVKGRLFTTEGSRATFESANPYTAVGSGSQSAVSVLCALRENTDFPPDKLVFEAIRYAGCGRYDVGGETDVVVV